MPNIEPVEFTLRSPIAFIDWLAILIFLLITIALGLYYTKRGTRSVNDYFASGQGVPWWILGTSMVATTFAADTPLAISGLFVTQGIWGNWFYWAQVPQFMLGVYFFSRLWRRAGILTDNELVDIRYSGKPAKLLRGFRALYFALPYNCLIIGWVNLSMTKILSLTFNTPKHWGVIISILITVGYSAMSGLWGVMVTSFFQFFLAMGMAIYLAVVAVQVSGGLGAMIDKLPQIYGSEKAASMLSIVPSADAPSFAFIIFLLYIFLMWWTTGPTDGGAFFAQRMISAKNEKHSFLGYLWFNLWHCALRPWPWILVGMAAAILFPGIAAINPLSGKLQSDPELGYIAFMLTYLKPGMLGVMLASFLAAFMSTISAQINWGASYLVNDFYRPFIKKNATEKHYIRISILAVILSAVFGGAISFVMNNIFFGWLLLGAINAGIGIVYIVRWYWWRINAWSEITAIASIIAVAAVMLLVKNEAALKAILTFLLVANILILYGWGIRKKEWRVNYLKSSIFILFMIIISLAVILIVTLPDKNFPWTLVYTVPVSISMWLTATMLTRPTDETKLIEFYRRVHPGGPGWKRIIAKIPEDYSAGHLFTRKNIIGTILGTLGTYALLFGLGQLFVGKILYAIVWFGILFICILFIVKQLSEEKWESGALKSRSS